MTAPATPPAPRKKRAPLRAVLRSVERLLAVIGLGALIHYACIDCTVVVSGSMALALRGDDASTGDRVILEKLTRHFRAPRRWEIHQFYTLDNLLVAKRVVGLPGERVSIRDGVLCINGAPLPIPDELAHLRYYAFGYLKNSQEIDCGPGYFVLGDDSRDSFDSRYVGAIARDHFIARAWFVLAPAAHRGFVL